MNKIFKLLLVTFLWHINAFSQNKPNLNNCAQLDSKKFNKVINGKQVGLYFLKNGDLTMAITNYGGRIVSLCAPDKNGFKEDVVLGFNSIDDYLNATAVYHGAIIGRVAGRISKGTFNIEENTYKLPLNGGLNHQHGGPQGFHNQVWDVKSLSDSSIVLTYLSIDKEMGYPGNLLVEATYSLNSKNELSLKLNATTDKSTPINLTNHAFFNLAGEGNGDILNHILTIPSNYITPVNADKIPTGKLLKVKGTPFDFRKGKKIGEGLVLESENDQLKLTGGFDHSYVLTKKDSPKVKLAATVLEPKSGRKLEILTNTSCIHLFSANFFKGADVGKMGKPFNYRASFALETQSFSDAPNQKTFPSIILSPNEVYEHTTIFRFSTDKIKKMFLQ